MTDTKLLLFLKAPQKGFVKTRLAQSIGDAAALDAYKSLASSQIKRIGFSFNLEIHFAPQDATALMEGWLGRDFIFIPQCEGDLGDRLYHAVRANFAAGAKRVILIGADCPDLGTAQLEEAERQLQEGADLVFGPCEDGGYYLVAMSAPHAALFSSTRWSSDYTLKDSLAYAEANNLKVALLETLYDVDTEAELKRADLSDKAE